MLGLSLRVSWICLLLFSSAACFPATKGDYRYPYTVSSSDSSGSAHGSNPQPDHSRRPLVSLQHEAASSGSQSPSSVGAPIVAAGSSQSYEPNKPSSAPAGSDVPAYRPAHEASSFVTFADPAGHTATSFNFGPAPYDAGADLVDEPVPYATPEAAYPYAAAGSPSPSWFSSGFADPAGHTATTFRMDGPVPYAPAADLGDASVPYPYGSPGLPWDEQPAGGADASFSDPSNWMPSRAFPDFNAWDSDSAMPYGGMQQGPSETSPLPPSSYIIQSSNGYQRAREVLSHTKYSPEYPAPPVMPFRAPEAPRKSPMTGSKGGQKV
ncbi:hypothetical protein D5F01_LYC17082 [Larimichthys crocea]|uniref:Uncharacterized protein n=1 Tax=Larimichthys crocea TaxID=215358 RepID=A0A6G0HXM2_LARCR|nr:hypothetical protein D5F01_LYC17082 [Larimichthys crocea]